MASLNNLQSEKEVTITFTGRCNNNCFFCSINKRGQNSYKEMARKINIQKKQGNKRVVFNGSEPTIQKDFLNLACLAKERFKIVQVNSNGRLFANRAFAQEVVDSGVNYFKIYLFGHNSYVHDRITRIPGSFNETVFGINNLLNLGQRDSMVLDIKVVCGDNLQNSNYFYLNKILALGTKLGLQKIQLSLVESKRNIKPVVGLGEIAKYISRVRYIYLQNVIRKIQGMPYCLIPEPEGVILKSENREGSIKLSKCKDCRYYRQCDGVPKRYSKNLDKKEIKPATLPKEIMIELTSRCNFHCSFCFNNASFAKVKNLHQELSTEYVKKIIDSIKMSGVSVVRFTGGEPMLRKDLLELIKYAKNKGLEVRLNTNAFLITEYKTVKKMVKYLDYVLFSMHTYDPKKDEVITGVKKSFEVKIRAIRWFKKAGIKVIRVSTIATMDNIRNLEKFYQLLKSLKVDKWATNRLIPLPGERKSWGKKELALLADKLTKIKSDIHKNKISLKLHIVNAAPLCALDPIKMNAICSGGSSVDGHERFTIDPRGFAKPIYYIDKNIGSPLDIIGCWNHPFMKSLRNYSLLPKECKSCTLLEKCKGGNRYCAYVATGSYRGKDPLMNYANIKNYLW